MTVFRMPSAQRASLAADIIAALNGGTIEVYDGALPDVPDDPVVDQTLLGTLALADPCGTYADGAITFNAITEESSAVASGTARFALLKDAGGEVRFDCDIGLATAENTTIGMNTTTIAALGPIRITSFAINIGDGA